MIMLKLGCACDLKGDNYLPYYSLFRPDCKRIINDPLDEVRDDFFLSSYSGRCLVSTTAETKIIVFPTPRKASRDYPKV